MDCIQSPGLEAWVCHTFLGLTCCSPEGIINSSCGNYFFFLASGKHFQGCGGAYRLHPKWQERQARVSRSEDYSTRKL